MKKCKACSARFEDHFRFCPIDGSVLEETNPHVNYNYRPTLISDQPLALRLIAELRFLIERLRRAWPRFQRHPVAFTRIQINRLRIELSAALARPHVASGLLTALALVCAVIASVLVLERRPGTPQTIDEAGDFARTITIDLNDSNQNEDSGIGAGDKGRVGFERGRGEGSRPVTARAQGGGSGGDHAPLPQSQGRLPQPSTIPAPIPTTFARRPPQALPAAGIDIDPVLWKDLPFPNYGDPRSKSVTPSDGSGDGGGVGPGKGTGIGEGEDNGFGPGKKGNIGGNENKPGGGGKGGAPGDNPNTEIDRVFRQSEVNVRAHVLFKPEPQYTEEARRNQITGTVILSVVFSRTGQVANIRAVQTLCCGLTEKAIAAARQIRFVPAVRNGQTVSTYMQLEYNFNLY